MTASVLAATIVGFIAAAVPFGLALRRPPRLPLHRVPWIIALVFIGISIAFRLVILVGVAFNGTVLDVLPVAIGNLAVALVFITAFRQPTWAGWVLIGTAVAVPLLTWVASAIAREPDPLEIAAPMAGFYGIPAIVTGSLLVLSGTWRRASAVPQ